MGEIIIFILVDHELSAYTDNKVNPQTVFQYIVEDTPFSMLLLPV